MRLTISWSKASRYKPLFTLFIYVERSVHIKSKVYSKGNTSLPQLTARIVLAFEGKGEIRWKKRARRSNSENTPAYTVPVTSIFNNICIDEVNLKNHVPCYNS